MGLEFASPYAVSGSSVSVALRGILADNQDTFHNVMVGQDGREFKFDFDSLNFRDAGETHDVFLLVEEKQIYLRFYAGLHKDAELIVEMLAKALAEQDIATAFDEP